MQKKYNEMNEFDKIIQIHQNDNNDIVELSEFRNQRWREEYIKKGKNIPRHLQKGRAKTILRYLVIENITENQWLVYDSETGQTLLIPFGDYTLLILNELLACSPNFIFHEKRRNEFFNSGIDIYENLKMATKSSLDELKKLFDALSTFDFYKKNHTQLEVKKYWYNLWLDYRYCYQPTIWSQIVIDRNATEDDFNGKDWISDNVEEIVEHCHANARESEETIHNIITREFFIYHGFTAWKFDKIPFVSGDTYVTNNINNIFSIDLFHILNGDTKTPHKCPRCGQLYFSNNNKSKYCRECKADSNIIRQENRRKNPCRYLHKQITDILNNYSEEGSEKFRIESNYYWEIVQGNIPEKTPISYNSNITTKEDYFKWLQEQKTIAKNPSAN